MFRDLPILNLKPAIHIPIKSSKWIEMLRQIPVKLIFLCVRNFYELEENYIRQKSHAIRLFRQTNKRGGIRSRAFISLDVVDFYFLFSTQK